MDEETAVSYGELHNMWIMTVGPGGLGYTPVDAFITELTYNRQDVQGLKTSVGVDEAAALVAMDHCKVGFPRTTRARRTPHFQHVDQRFD